MAKKDFTKETVKLNYLRIAPRKARLVTEVIKKLSVNEAEAQLMLMPNRVAGPILKLLRSGVANVKHNYEVETNNLTIENIVVNNGPMLKRFLPRAMGRATPIQKKSSHIVLTLAPSAKPVTTRFNIVVPDKSKPAASKKEKTAPKPKINRAIQETAAKGGLMGRVKKLFN